MKTCSACDVEKPLNEFGFHRSRNIYEARCRRCRYRIRHRNSNNYLVVHSSIFRKWDALDEARFLTWVVLGVPIDEIVILLQRGNAHTLRCRLSKLRQMPHYASIIAKKYVQIVWTPDRIAALREMIDVRGYSRSRAAEAFGVTKNAVISATQRHLPMLCSKKSIPYTKCQRARVGI